MSPSCSITPPADLAAYHAYRAFTPAEHEALQLDPNIHLELSPFPPFSDSRPRSASFSSISTTDTPLPKVEETEIPRGLCDMYTPAYEPVSIVWTNEEGEIGNRDADIYNAECLEKLALCFPQYKDVVAEADPQDPRSVKKVTNLLWKYAKQERERSWGSTIVAPSATWDDPERNAQCGAAIRRQKHKPKAVGKRKLQRVRLATQARKARRATHVAKQELQKGRLSSLRSRQKVAS